ncbi:hypothetical protein FFZ99_16745 [Leptospira interrogans]|uniref:Uncharacterized protein n=2 Tax=Leptospira interrogans TaxID=173 RepID=A0A0F6IBM6_LEPIR|nr:hypothetical protein B2G50_11255 [Leptospira interrogans serovar Canicola]EJO76973.1 hypothetical protein LEP1GSC045_2955 [Leptospira interrogans serovar Pomona str. Kennewicki LC82-25]EKN97236.1 hypothetical protein LEP1GSC014_2896 [Leptospira interrogans serovar Pomona str. Pomona]EKO70722.1 hypothetical protein LEP1GSC069_0877 [Leptospira interrogans serovar Canicola str. Fiocruz LV133]EKR37618.1 hypothetical protein LEP1GSC096_1014 [Leptospira interrogans serovar Hebdomadis str. R499]EK
MQNSDSHFFEPNPSTPYPFPEFSRIGFLKNFIQSALIEVGIPITMVRNILKRKMFYITTIFEEINF